MADYNYKFGLIAYEQKELTWKQDKQIIEMINKLTRNALANGDNLQIGEIANLVLNNNLTDVFFGMILRPKITAVYILSFKWIRLLVTRRISVDQAPNSTIKKIFDDFFLLNKPLVNKLKQWLNSLDLVGTMAQKMKQAV